MPAVFPAMSTSLGASKRLLDSVAASRRTPGTRLHTLAMAIFAGLEAVAVALGLTIYAADPFGFLHPRLALAAVLAMVAIAVVARALPALRRHATGTRSLEVVALFLYATLTTFSMGAANSPFIALYALALLASALIWDPWPVAAAAILTFGFTFLQTHYLDLMDEMPLFTIVVVLLNALLPAAVAATVISMVRRLLAAGGGVSVGHRRNSGPSAACSTGTGCEQDSEEKPS